MTVDEIIQAVRKSRLAWRLVQGSAAVPGERESIRTVEFQNTDWMIGLRQRCPVEVAYGRGDLGVGYGEFPLGSGEREVMLAADGHRSADPAVRARLVEACGMIEQDEP